MQDILFSKKVKDSILKHKNYQELIYNNISKEYVLYSDNILEGISMLNMVVESGNDELMKFVGVVYEPVDQPTYVFKKNDDIYFSIKISGVFNNWELPDQVSDMSNYVDLPDFVLYSISTKKAILAGENTETASVGNSQWQREGRKVGSSVNNVPFVYQTFYSGRDVSQDTVREPTSLQVYNHIIYSIRYKVPSFVVYFENNFSEDNIERADRDVNGKNLYSKYFILNILCDYSKEYVQYKKDIEIDLYKHMVSYLVEPKIKADGSYDSKPRIEKDFPIINERVLDEILSEDNRLPSKIIEYIYSKSDEKLFLTKYPLLDFNLTNKKNWNSYRDKNNIGKMVSHLIRIGKAPYSYRSPSKVGIVNAREAVMFLKSKGLSENSSSYLLKFDELVLMPVRIHKNNNNILTFSPDPESGEIVAFSELLSLDILGNKIRPVIGYCIVDTPDDFDFEDKNDTKLYRAISNYVDVLIINDSKIYTNFKKSEKSSSLFIPQNLTEIKPKHETEEIAVVSTFLNLGTIKSDWRLCFIHTHHSSWQQLVILKKDISRHLKINRNDSKIDLIMQNDERFILAEGKEKYESFFNTQKEIDKIRTALINSGSSIDGIMNKNTEKIYSFICLLDIPEINGDFFFEKHINIIEDSVISGHLDQIVNGNYVVIVVYKIKNVTLFKLIFSEQFDMNNKIYFEDIFNS